MIDEKPGDRRDADGPHIGRHELPSGNTLRAKFSDAALGRSEERRNNRGKSQAHDHEQTNRYRRREDDRADTPAASPSGARQTLSVAIRTPIRFTRTTPSSRLRNADQIDRLE